jgi:hypothetical protein
MLCLCQIFNHSIIYPKEKKYMKSMYNQEKVKKKIPNKIKNIRIKKIGV